MKEWLTGTLHALNGVTSMDQPEGFTRLGYSVEESAAIERFEAIARSLNLVVRRDYAGNSIATWYGSDNSLPAIAMGSHLDTVKNGGGYDGVAGIVSGLAAVKALQDQQFQPLAPIEVICFASEESSRFGVSTIGSKAMTGQLDLEDLRTIQDESGMTVEQAVAERGLNWSDFTLAERDENELHSFLEVHIEQGVRIEQAGREVGVVAGVACPVRLIVTIQGMAGHTGTTPMNSRSDALVAAAPLISFVSKRAAERSELASYPLVGTVSTIQNEPNVMTVIPDRITLGIDIRSVDDQEKRLFAEEVRSKCAELADEYSVSVSVDTFVNNDSVWLDSNTATKLEEACERAGVSFFKMESGAGHDVMNMAAKWPSGLLFVPCKDGISHHPSETTSLEDLEHGILVLINYLLQESGE